MLEFFLLLNSDQKESTVPCHHEEYFPSKWSLWRICWETGNVILRVPTSEELVQSYALRTLSPALCLLSLVPECGCSLERTTWARSCYPTHGSPLQIRLSSRESLPAEDRIVERSRQGFAELAVFPGFGSWSPEADTKFKSPEGHSWMGSPPTHTHLDPFPLFGEALLLPSVSGSQEREGRPSTHSFPVRMYPCCSFSEGWTSS